MRASTPHAAAVTPPAASATPPAAATPSSTMAQECNEESPYGSMVAAALSPHTRLELGLPDGRCSPLNAPYVGVCDECEREDVLVKSNYPGWLNLVLCAGCWGEKHSLSAST